MDGRRWQHPVNHREQVTTMQEHPEDPRQARPQAPDHLVQRQSYRGSASRVGIEFLITCLKNLLWHQFLVNHNFKHKLLNGAFNISSS